MIRPKSLNKKQVPDPGKKQKKILELVATLLAFMSVFVFFLKILFF